MTTRKQSKHRKPARTAVPKETQLFSPRAMGNPFPMSTDLMFVYYDQTSIDSTSGAVSHYLFSANGMYDPDITGTGHQPLGFDQWLGLFYNDYCVYKSEIDVTFQSQASDNTGQAVCLIGLADDSSSSTNVTVLYENPTYVKANLGSIGSGRDTVRLTKKCDVATYFGLSREALLADSTHRGNSAGNPADTVLFDIAVSANNSTVNPANVVVLARITYWAHLTQRRELATS